MTSLLVLHTSCTGSLGSLETAKILVASRRAWGTTSGSSTWHPTRSQNLGWTYSAAHANSSWQPRAAASTSWPVPRIRSRHGCTTHSQCLCGSTRTPSAISQSRPNTMFVSCVDSNRQAGHRWSHISASIHSIRKSASTLMPFSHTPQRKKSQRDPRRRWSCTASVTLLSSSHSRGLVLTIVDTISAATLRQDAFTA